MNGTYPSADPRGRKLLFQQVSEKTLREILCIMHSCTRGCARNCKAAPNRFGKARLSAAPAISGSAWLLPAASTTVQWVEGNKSL